MRGAKSKYKPEFCALVERWASEGLTDEMIYANLKIGHDSFYKYLREHAEFAEALKRGRAPINNKVENALLKRALGYEYEETRTEYVDDGSGGPMVKTKVVTKKVVVPDVAAQIFWLKNRMPTQWRDRQEHDHLIQDARQGIRELFGGIGLIDERSGQSEP